MMEKTIYSIFGIQNKRGIYYMRPDYDGVKFYSDNDMSIGVNFEKAKTLVNEYTVASARACLYTFYKDVYLLDKLKGFYEKNDCDWNDQNAAILTSEGIYIEYSKGTSGDGHILIYNVAKPY